MTERVPLGLVDVIRRSLAFDPHPETYDWIAAQAAWSWMQAVLPEFAQELVVDELGEAAAPPDLRQYF